MENITKDAAYDAVDPRDFRSMMDVERYGARSTAFDKIISATHDHFWDPLDPKYIDFSEPWDIENVFSWPGIGQMLVDAILKRDFPLVQGGVLLVATVYVVVNLLTDLLYAMLDPRIALA